MSNNFEEDRFVGIDRAESVNFHLDPISTWMKDPNITEVCVNRPGEVWCERNSQWEQHECPALTFGHMHSLATAVARYSTNDITAIQPILSAILPNGERAQFVMPPACDHGTISLTIRKPSFMVRTLTDYANEGFFSKVKPITNELKDEELELLRLQKEKKYDEFLRRAVQLEKVIIVAGETGSGKTTFMKGLVEEIPATQRIITIEDVPELFLPNHPNHVHLFYPSEAKEEENAPVTAATLLKSCLRMKPSRILPAELRGGEAFDFINVASSGHGGSITSCHAGSVALTFERLALMILQNRQGRTLPYDVIKKLLYMVVDVVIHVHNDYTGNFGRHLTELWYEPALKHSA